VLAQITDLNQRTQTAEFYIDKCRDDLLQLMKILMKNLVKNIEIVKDEKEIMQLSLNTSLPFWGTTSSSAISPLTLTLILMSLTNL